MPDKLGVLTQAEVMTLLRALEYGWLTAVEVGLRGTVREWSISNGWRIKVFDDAGEWDYIDSVFSADGRAVGYTTMHHNRDWGTEVAHYEPSFQTLKDVYDW